MKREELKEKIEECILRELPFISFENGINSIMYLIDEYTKPKGLDIKALEKKFDMILSDLTPEDFEAWLVQDRLKRKSID